MFTLPFFYFQVRRTNSCTFSVLEVCYTLKTFQTYLFECVSNFHLLFTCMMQIELYVCIGINKIIFDEFIYVHNKSIYFK